MVNTKLNAKAFGLVLGILSAATMVFFSLWVMFIGTGEAWMNMAADFYFGYSTTFTGMLLGAIYGFIDGFVGGWVFAWLYNKLV
ncbi:MAG: bacteriophage holin [archaeon]